MSKIVKNVTGSPITVTDVGVTVPASSQYTIPPQDYLLWAASSDVITFIGAASLVINDGSVDLSISAGVDLIKGLFERIAVGSPTIANLPLTLSATEYSYTFPVGMRRFDIKTRNNARLQLSYVSGQSGTVFSTIPVGCNFGEYNISRQSALTLYVQSSEAGETLEITYWT